MEKDYPVETATLVSFLVNALYLFGGQTVAAAGAPSEVTSELTRLGHRLRADGAGAPRRGDGGLDRIFVSGTFGRGDDHLARLRALRKELRPGGLVAFHVLDRDRAWERTGIWGKDGAQVRVAFDPADGRLTARAMGVIGVMEKVAPVERAWSAVPAGPATGIQTWNLGELRSLVKAAGLEWERAYGDWQGGAPGSGRLIVVAARPIGRRQAAKARYRKAA